MASNYWSQWSHGELMSMQGIDDDPKKDQDEVEVYLCQQCNCGACMDCLGLSWRDFM